MHEAEGLIFPLGSNTVHFNFSTNKLFTQYFKISQHGCLQSLIENCAQYYMSLKEWNPFLKPLAFFPISTKWISPYRQEELPLSKTRLLLR